MKSICIFLLLVMCACGRNPLVETDLNLILVRSILSSDYPSQTVSLELAENVVYIDGKRQTDTVTPIVGATVVLKSDIQEIIFQEVEPGKYQDVDEKLQVLPGHRYTLEVRDKDGRTASASTTVPSGLHLQASSGAESFKEGDAITFTWEKPKHTGGVYDFGIILMPNVCQEDMQPGYMRWALGSTTEQVVQAYRFCDLAEESREFKVSAFDSAIVFWEYPGWYAPGPSQQTSNIHNGLGVFGSAISDTCRIRILPR